MKRNPETKEASYESEVEKIKADSSMTKVAGSGSGRKKKSKRKK